MVDTYVSGAYEEIREGSSPFSDTIKEEHILFFLCKGTQNPHKTKSCKWFKREGAEGEVFCNTKLV